MLVALYEKIKHRKYIKSVETSNEKLSSIYENMIHIYEKYPQFENEILQKVTTLIQRENNTGLDLAKAYAYIYAIIWKRSDPNKKIMETIHIGLKNPNNSSLSISNAYMSLFQMDTSHFLADDIFNIVKTSLSNPNINYENLTDAYKVLAQLVVTKPELAGDILDVMKSSIYHPQNNRKSMEFAHYAFTNIVEQKPNLAKDVLNTLNNFITSPNYSCPSFPLYNSLSIILSKRPDLANDVLDTLKLNSKNSIKEAYKLFSDLITINPDLTNDVVKNFKNLIKNPSNNSDDLAETYNTISTIIKIKPELTADMLETFKETIQHYNNYGKSLNSAYNNLSLIEKEKPEFTQNVLEILKIGLTNNKNDKNSLEAAYKTLGYILQTNPSLKDQIQSLIPDINIDVLHTANNITQENVLLYDVYKRLNTLETQDIRRLEQVFTSKHLDADDKQSLIEMMMENELPLKDVTSFNPSSYREIKNLIVSNSEKNQKVPEESFYDNNKCWMIKSAICANVLYKKDYKKYFDTIEQYNNQLPKLKALMPEVLKEVAEKSAVLEINLKQVQEQKAKNDTRIAEIDYQNNDFDSMRERYDELGIKERGIKGNLTGIKSYIDYEPLQKISMEKATAWMKHAIKTQDRELLLKRINGALLSTNPNILACGKSGQPFIRLDHQTVSLNEKGDRETEYTDELMLVSTRWNNIPKEIRNKSFKEIVGASESYKFKNPKSMTFLQSNGKYIHSQAVYEKAEQIYLQGCLTPSRFKKKEHYSQDGNWRCYIADKDDPRPLYAGGTWKDRAKCCQNYGTQASSCAIDSVLNPDSGCVIFERKTKDGWDMRGCSWLYEIQSDQYKSLIFDNVEISNDSKKENKAIYEAFSGLVDSLAQNNYRELRIGNSPSLSIKPKIEAYNRESLPWNYSINSYSDATTQYILRENPQAIPEQLPEIMIMGMDIEVHKNDIINLTKKLYPEDNKEVQIPDNARGMVLINRDNLILGYAIWTENAKVGHNTITDIVIKPEYQDKDCGISFLSTLMQHIKKTGGIWEVKPNDIIGTTQNLQEQLIESKILSTKNKLAAKNIATNDDKKLKTVNISTKKSNSEPYER